MSLPSVTRNTRHVFIAPVTAYHVPTQRPNKTPGGDLGNPGRIEQPATTPASIASSGSSGDLTLTMGGGTDFLQLDFRQRGGLVPPLNDMNLGGRELELMHHYSVNTADTLAIQDDVRHIWRHVIPEEGDRHAFIMDGMLAISALHKSLLVPSMRQDYLTLAAHYQSSGLKGYTLQLPDVNIKNWIPVFCFAALTVIYVSLLPVRCENHVLPEPMPSMLELFAVTRGMQSFLEPYLENLVTTPFAPLFHGTQGNFKSTLKMTASSYTVLDQACIPKDAFTALSRLRAVLAKHAPAAARKDYLDAVAALERTAALIAAAGMHVDPGTVFIWAYEVSGRVLADVRGGRARGAAAAGALLRVPARHGEAHLVFQGLGLGRCC
ncbi:uncharacterized protein VDAG_08904 [Verticillium dahliae VdLs.17]|uniref:C6 zinc finger domain-containing protein n=1 Tax=Verticillium dahliae (strain VdLs.17 / ATCC MYA-4575 / FGSC 10137) TaxID=498257 RepID=G2XGB7_VERDV|nr:uncharacterized protein VDAG_08904 [Verticillium dahliae VdLs.17]EGY18744.1 hypothetical protein VDAG_08904 [Verticillium dahliae VdLs.17]KAH6702440.1 hypothetical protein EV126DRAFT_494978 [Verticillium dahliae]